MQSVKHNFFFLNKALFFYWKYISHASLFCFPYYTNKFFFIFSGSILKSLWTAAELTTNFFLYCKEPKSDWETLLCQNNRPCHLNFRKNTNIFTYTTSTIFPSDFCCFRWQCDVIGFIHVGGEPRVIVIIKSLTRTRIDLPVIWCFVDEIVA